MPLTTAPRRCWGGSAAPSSTLAITPTRTATTRTARRPGGKHKAVHAGLHALWPLQLGECARQLFRSAAVVAGVVRLRGGDRDRGARPRVRAVCATDPGRPLGHGAGDSRVCRGDGG